MVALQSLKLNERFFMGLLCVRDASVYPLLVWGIGFRQFYLLIVVGGMRNNLYIVVQVLFLIRPDEREK